MGKLVSVLKCVDVRGCIACPVYVMYVGVGNLQKHVIAYKFSMRKTSVKISLHRWKLVA